MRSIYPLVSFVLACGSDRPSERPVASGASGATGAPVAPSAPSDAAVAVVDSGAPPGPPAPTCLTTGGGIERVLATADGAIACFRGNGDEECWRVDHDAEATWVPAPAPTDTAITAPSHDDMTVVMPDGATAKVLRDPDEDFVTAIDVCFHADCKRVPIARTRKLDLDDFISAIALAPDNKHLWVDRGMSLMSLSRVEVYALDPKPKLLRTVSIPRMSCTSFEQFLDDDAVLLQGSDCANAGGWRGIASIDGKLRATIALDASFGAKFVRVAPHRWAFSNTYDLEFWDTSKGRLLKRLEGTHEEPYSDQFAMVGDELFVIDHNGAYMWFDRDLQPLGLAQIPRCDEP